MRRRAPLSAAVQVAFESKGLKPGFHFIYAQCLKPGAVKLWVKWIQRVQPHLERDLQVERAAHPVRALQLQVCQVVEG
jgi:hypothetical protein